MSDDVKKAVEALRAARIAVRTGLVAGQQPEQHCMLTLEDRDTILAHIDAEPARAKRVFAEGMAAGRARFLVDLKALLEVK